MNEKISKVLEHRGGNYILPFFWLHGEDAKVLRHYMKVIYDCGIRAVCLESRPHPDFAGPQWWADLDVILAEARRLEMKVWILDDSHFPTGYCNGAIKQEPPELRRQSITYKILAEAKAGETVLFDREDYLDPPAFRRNLAEQYLVGEIVTFTDDACLGVVAVNSDGRSFDDTIQIAGGGEEPLPEQLCFTAPEGSWRLYACYLTRNRGPHRDYMNMMDRESCHKLIEAVYEPHYARYKEDFGTTIAGFFSDEPELGNGHLYELNQRMDEVDDQPWSREVAAELLKRWGDDWLLRIPLLWEQGFDAGLKARVRYDYMDVVTRCVEQDFSYQIGDWCRSHGVEYIGHMIEDNNQHSRCGSSLGHFFRGLAGQDMSGIDDIGGQVLPQQEDTRMMTNWSGERDGVFYHYALGVLGASAAAIDPLKRGRAMCEIFGNYGWEEGVYLEKYLADHFMVRGINRFVPHAFSAKAFPDPDCPPHFYAHGHNPQYRHFGRLMGYMNRICELISDGCRVVPAAILYHGEADWTGGACMFGQVPARILADCQINYDFIPADVFAEVKYQTVLGENLQVHTQKYQMLIVPETGYITAETAQAAARLTRAGFPVLFINRLPEGICNCSREQEAALLDGLGRCRVVALAELARTVRGLHHPEVTLAPEQPLIRYLHYYNGSQLYYFVNEGTAPYCGTITIAETGSCYAYDAWENRLEKVVCRQQDGRSEFAVAIEPRKSLILIFDEPEAILHEPLVTGGNCLELMDGWQRSTCKAIEYPVFGSRTQVDLPDQLEKEQPEFGGFIRYEQEINLAGVQRATLEITGEAEGVEVFVNGTSAGIQIVPAYRFDISHLIKEGKNRIIIESATTLERVIPKTSRIPGRVIPPPSNRCGIQGQVKLWVETRTKMDGQQF